ncbi:Thiamine-binding periplasmic protein precursor [Kluyvera intermedia]|nr:Thiamine-binding periplasmic protein precursor [Kluyvera intermedia]
MNKGAKCSKNYSHCWPSLPCQPSLNPFSRSTPTIPSPPTGAPGPAVKKAFEVDCHCELKFVALEDGVSLLNRLRMEGKNSKADVVLGLDNNLLQAATETKLFAKSNVPASAVNVPGGWNNDTFVPFDYGYFAFVYDKNKLKNPPKNLKELVESDQKWRVIYQDPRTSTPGLGLLLWMQKVYGDKAPEAWQKLAAKTVTVTKGWE